MFSSHKKFTTTSYADEASNSSSLDDAESTASMERDKALELKDSLFGSKKDIRTLRRYRSRVSVSFILLQF